MRKRERILTIVIILLTISLIGLLLVKYIQKENKEDKELIKENKDNVYYLVTTQKVVDDEVTFLDGISYKLIKKENTMEFCYEEINECTEISYYVKDNTYEIDTWGEDNLSGTFFIVSESNNNLVIEKQIDNNTKIINYFESNKF